MNYTRYNLKQQGTYVDFDVYGLRKYLRCLNRLKLKTNWFIGKTKQLNSGKQ